MVISESRLSDDTVVIEIRNDMYSVWLAILICCVPVVLFCFLVSIPYSIENPGLGLGIGLVPTVIAILFAVLILFLVIYRVVRIEITSSDFSFTHILFVRLREFSIPIKLLDYILIEKIRHKKRSQYRKTIHYHLSIVTLSGEIYPLIYDSINSLALNQLFLLSEKLASALFLRIVKLVDGNMEVIDPDMFIN